MSELLEKVLFKADGRIVTKEDLKLFDDLMYGFVGAKYVPFYVSEHTNIGAHFITYYCLGYGIEQPDVCMGIYTISFVKYVVPHSKYHFSGIKKLVTFNVTGIVVKELTDSDKTSFKNQYGDVLGVQYDPLLRIDTTTNLHFSYWFATMTPVYKDPHTYHVFLPNKDVMKEEAENLLKAGGWSEVRKATAEEVALAEKVYNDHKIHEIDSRYIEVKDIRTQIVNGTNYEFTVEEFVGLYSEGLFKMRFHLSLKHHVSFYTLSKI